MNIIVYLNYYFVYFIHLFVLNVSNHYYLFVNDTDHNDLDSIDSILFIDNNYYFSISYTVYSHYYCV
jgi:hypothetical protein